MKCKATKIISFNVNGLRARLHQLQAVIDQHDPDIIGLQETKVSNDDFPMEAVKAMGYEVVMVKKVITALPCLAR